MISLDDIHSYNIWFSWSKPSNYRKKLRCHASDGRTKEDGGGRVGGRKTESGKSGRPENEKIILLFHLPQVLDQDKEKMTKVEGSKSKNGRLVMARGRCWTGTWKKTLEITGFLVDQGIKDLTYREL